MVCLCRAKFHFHNFNFCLTRRQGFMGHRAVQVLAVMDCLTALEAAWHAGHFLPQSVYTCLYMLLPDRCCTLHRLSPG
jgi:Mak10 subunit, NatC N(alpha)-terminal acetyltransferase